VWTAWKPKTPESNKSVNTLSDGGGGEIRLEVEHGGALCLQGRLCRLNGAQRGVDLLEDRLWRPRQLRGSAGVSPGPPSTITGRLNPIFCAYAESMNM